MKALLGILGLAAVAIALLGALDPPQPAVLIDFPAPIAADPIDDLNLKPADWQRCAPVPMPPLTDPAPGKVRRNYHTRDGGIA